MTQLAVASRTSLLLEEAERLFPGGVNSPVRAFRAVERAPLVLERGLGPHVWDTEGHRYVDLIGAWGAAILGHADPRVIEAIARTAADGLALGATHPLEVRLGELIGERMPSVERLRFTSSGTEAVMSALRVARAATGRDLVVKFAGAYHGHVDSLLASAGSGVATLGIPGSTGVTPASASQTIVLPWNDASAVTTTFARRPGQIAAVIVEPVIANMGLLPARPGFLEHLRELTRADGALLVFDEVITGFRLGPGGAQARFGIRPDLTTLGKVIGGGMPVGAYGGRADLMSLVAPEGPVYQAGTLAGHPVAMAAGIATLSAMTGDVYVALEDTAASLERGLRAAIAETGAEVSVSRVGSLLGVAFRAAPPDDADEAADIDRAAAVRFFGAMLSQGVLLPPSPFEAWFLSVAHGPAEVQAVVDAARTALRT